MIINIKESPRDMSLEAFCQELEEARKIFDTTLLGDAAKTIRELCGIIDYAASQAAAAIKQEVFSPDEVASLELFQRARQMHPFTCPNRGDGNHRDTGVDLGALVPTVRGWICPYCDYTQDWAHGFMKGKPNE